MKKIKAILLAAAVLLCGVCLSGCGRYVSHYQAVGFVHSQDADSAFMTFYQFKGTMVFQLRGKSGGQLQVSGKLEEGSVVVYYDADGTKTELFSLRAEEEFHTQQPVGDGTVYVMVETEGQCRNGDFRFEIVQP